MKKNIEKIYALTPMQEGMLFYNLREETDAYFTQISYAVNGEFSIALLKECAQTLSARHDALRTAFVFDKTEHPIQVVLRNRTMELHTEDIADLEAKDQEAYLNNYCQQDKTRGFDLTKEVLLRLAVFQTGPAKYQFVWSFHHIILDGWCHGILIREFSLIYQALATGQAMDLPPAMPFANYVKWLEKQDTTAALNYWNEYLDAYEETAKISGDLAATANDISVSSKQELTLSETQQAQLKAIAQEQHLTLNTLFQALWGVVLAHYSNTRDVVYGNVVSGRPPELPGADQMLGLFVNTIPLRVTFDETTTFTTLLQQLHRASIEALPFHYTSLAAIQAQRSKSEELIHHLMSFQNYLMEEQWSNQGAFNLENAQIEESTNYGLVLDVHTGNEWVLGFTYHTDCYSETFIAALKNTFADLIEYFIADTERKVADWNLPQETISQAEAQRILVDFNHSEKDFSTAQTVLDFFAAQVAKQPEQTALTFSGKSLSYAELDARSNQLANYLLAQNTANPWIGILLAPGFEMLVSVLAIMKAGRAYVPIDPNYPAERINYIIEDAGLELLLSQTEYRETGKGTLNCIDLHTEWATIAQQATTAPELEITPESPAYLIYTSGSTGKPKGVMIAHRSLAIKILSEIDLLGLDQNMTACLLTNYVFDVSLLEIFLPLTAGGKLLIPEKEDIFDPQRLFTLLVDAQVSLLQGTPGFFSTLFEALDKATAAQLSLERICIGGESLQNKLVQLIRRKLPQAKINNHYGPTEATVDAIVLEDVRHFEHNIIGKPLANTEAYVVDAQMQLLPVGVQGELLIGGDALAIGYLNREELTNEKFIPHPFLKDKNAKVYRTGDLAKWTPDGHLEFFGRMDDQVKIRGYRMELGEIEAVLLQFPAISQCAVMVKESAQGEKRLFAAIIADPDFQRTALNQFLAEQLPEYMIPSSILECTTFPLTPNGKVDRRALAKREEEVEETVVFVAPRNETEEKLATIWSHLLEVEQVGVHHNFFALGGHSLLAIRVMSAIKKEMDLSIHVNDVFTYPTVAELAAHLGGELATIALPPITARNAQATLPLSFSQERLWFIDQLEGSTHYHMPAVLELKGALDITVLEKAFRGIVNRHEVLRTCLREVDGLATQHILAPDQWTLVYDEQLVIKSEEHLQALIEAEVHRPFDLTLDHMLRAHLFKVSEGDYRLLWVMHHIASDGWSVAVFAKELVAFYEAFQANEAVALPELTVQYADYAIWQRDYLEGKAMEESLEYWENQLQGTTPLNLPFDFPRPAIQSTKGRTFHFELDTTLTNHLKKLSREQDVTLFMLLLAAFKVLLYRYSGQQDICVGSPIANRLQKELEPLIGFFVNTIALRSDLSDNPTFIEVLKQVKATTLDAYQHQSVPFDKIVSRVEENRSRSHSPVFQVLFVVQNAPDIPTIELGDVSLTFQSYEHEVAKFDLACYLFEAGDQLRVEWEYCTDLFLPQTMERMAKHYRLLLSAICEESQQKINQLNLLDTAEVTQILHDFNQNETILLQTQDNIVNLFQEQVRQTPQHTALVFGTQSITYRELEEQSNQLAHFLRGQGVQAEALVAICMDRSIEMIIGLWGILKTGAAYVPLDPNYPQERIDYILEDAGAKLLLTTKANARPSETTRQIVWEEHWSAVQKESPRALNTNLPSRQLAYTIYTSGSTGKPKGVMITHGNVQAFIKWCQLEFAESTFDVVFAGTSICFDLSIFEIFYTLSVGKKIRLLEDGTQIANWITQEEKILINTVPSVMVNLLEEEVNLHRVTVINLAGEPIPQMVADRIDLNRIEVRNLYGPSEDTTYSTVYRLADHQPILIGRPICNTQVFILDDTFQPVPIGVVGELCISGAGLALGYLNRPNLTKEKFIANPIPAFAANRMYRTGDLARWRPDGNIDFLGRKDAQIKIRGYRIELGEIETILQQLPIVHQAVVLALPSGNSKRLVGFVVPQGEFDEKAIQTFLAGHLPDYMRPAVLVELEELPLLPNGKINKKALAKIEVAATNEALYVAPTNALEENLANLWKKLLGREEAIGIHDNFFALGGHSLLATRVVAAIKKEWTPHIKVKDIFAQPTIAALAAHIEQQENGPTEVLSASARLVQIPLSFSQERLWFLDQLQGSTAYHIPAVFQLQGKLDQEVLEEAFVEIVNRHEVLRTRFAVTDGVAYQNIFPKDQWRLSVLSEIKQEQQDVADWIRTIINQPFDLSKDSPLRVQLIPRGKEQYLLVVVLHHIAADGWSLPILMEEWKTLYQVKTEKGSANLAPLHFQYADYALWQRSAPQQAKLEAQLDYWTGQLQGLEPLNLPEDFPRPGTQSTRGASRSFTLGKTLNKKLNTLAQDQGVTLFMVLLAAFKVLLHKYSGQDDICVGTPIANRTQREIEPLIGFFLNTLAIRSELKTGASFTQLLTQVKTTTLEAYDHQEVPFEKIVDSLQLNRDRSRTPIFQTLFILQNTEALPALELEDLQITPETLNNTTAKFDLTFELREQAAGLDLIVEYCTDLYLPTTIERMVQHFELLLSNIVANPEAEIHQLSILTAKEKQQLIADFNATSQTYPHDKTMVELLAAQVEKSPEAIALVYEGGELTYRELDQQANQLANYLRESGVREEQMIALCLHRNPFMVVAMLGVLKAGGAYVPVDPDYPADRINYILEDTAAHFVLCNEEYAAIMDTREGQTILCIEKEEAAIFQMSKEAPQTDLHANSLMYAIYTSGSTGRPKGVLIEHRSQINFLYGMRDCLTADEHCHFLALASYSFDISCLEIYFPLLCGGKVILADRSLATDAYALKEFITQYRANHLQATPGTWRLLLDSGWKNDTQAVLMSGGEAIKESLKAELMAFGETVLLNLYGPTETTVWATTRQLELDVKVNVGRPISNVQIYITDDTCSALVPVGVPGELCVGGDGLGRRYLNRPELTAEKFIDNPFAPERSAKIYRTGDLARWLPNGEIEHLGRKDDQVKIRGHRIELGEIESVLQSAPQVRQGVVLAPQDANGNRRLVAYVLPEDLFSKEKIQQFLKSQLPDYMVPPLIMELDYIPLTHNGKVDKKALPNPEASALMTHEYIAPRNNTETAIANIWKDLLKVERVGINDNFFELGGDSIITVQVVSRAKEQGFDLTPRDLFDFQTVATIATFLEEKSTTETGILTGACALSPVQQAFWEENQSTPNAFYESRIFEIAKSISADQLERAVQAIVEQQDSLRFYYESAEGQWQQFYGTNAEPFEQVELTGVSGEELSAKIHEIRAAYAQQLDTAQGIVFKTVFLPTGAQEMNNRLLILAHQLVVDANSWEILENQLEQALATPAEDSIDLGTKTSSFRQWVNHLAEKAPSTATIAQETYWKNASGWQQSLIDRQDEGKPGFAIYQHILDRPLSSEALTAINQSYQTLTEEIAIAALVQTLSEWADRKTILIGLQGNGRDMTKLDVSQTVACFDHHYPQTFQLEEISTEGDLIKMVKEQLRAVPEKGLGYGLLRYLNDSFSNGTVPSMSPWEIEFNYREQGAVLSGEHTLGQSDKQLTLSEVVTVEAPLRETIQVSMTLENKRLSISWKYNPNRYHQELMEALAHKYTDCLNALLQHCEENQHTFFTPADFGLNGKVTAEELDDFLGTNESEGDEILIF